MKKSFKVKGIDCPNCAAKVEKHLNKIDGIEQAIVNFTTERMSIIAPEDKIDSIIQESIKIVKELEPEWEVLI